MTMSLDALRTLVANSTSDDWEKMDHPPVAPMFHPSRTHDHGLELDAAYHDALLTYRNNIDVQVAYGMDYDHIPTGQENHRPRVFEWAESFLHSDATMVRVHTLYRGSVVDHTVVLSFDGAWLPLPEVVDDGAGDFKHVFAGRSRQVARLLHSIDYAADADEADRMMRRSGLEIAD